MYTGLQHFHSGWAYLALLLLVVAVINAAIRMSNKPFTSRDRKISLFAMIATHIQLLIGIVLLFTSPYWTMFTSMDMGAAMQDSVVRLYVVEHPLTNIIAIALITIGWSRHKKQSSDNTKFKSIAIFYGLGLLLLLSRIPWSAWMS